jgi:hypothetical protein
VSHIIERVTAADLVIKATHDTLILETPTIRILIDGLVGSGIVSRISSVLSDADILDALDPDRDERECSRCGDEVLVLNTLDECSACEAGRANGDICLACGVDIDWSTDMHAYRPHDGSGAGGEGPALCGSCVHNERRSG